MADIDMNAPEVQEAIAAAIEDVKTDYSKKVAKLHAENARWRRVAQEKDVLNGADVDELIAQKMEEYEEKLKLADSQVKKLSKELEASRLALDSENKSIRNLLVENGLNEALTKAGVKPEYLKAAKAMFAKDVQVIADGENRVAKVGDKALTDFVSEWAQSDEGKHFVTAPANSGGGAGAGKGGNLTPSKKASEMNPAEKAAFIKEHGIDKWSAKVGADYAG